MAREPTELILPPGITREPDPPQFPPMVSGRGTIVNETSLPDDVVRTYVEEHASVLGVSGSTFQNYVNSGGSILARGRFRTPSNVIEEIILSRDLAERDDDVRATIGQMLAIAFGDGMQNTHEDETTIALYDEVARHAKLDQRFKELYREWLIAGQVTTLLLFQRQAFQFKPGGGDRNRTRSVTAPLIGVLPSENILPIGNDIVGTAPLYYRPQTAEQESWLHEFFSDGTSPGRKLEMRRADPVLTSMLTSERDIADDFTVNALYTADNPNPASGRWVYLLNPRMVSRSTMAKGAWSHPRPLMTANFALLEAKRLLNIMDYALLEGGSNFIVVAKQGSDARPGMPQELAALHEVLKRATKTGLIVGDHRLTIEILTPELTELLNSDKRRLVGRKLARLVLRLPDYTDEGESGEGVKADLEMIQRVITDDRNDLRRHVEDTAYREAAIRNDNVPGAAGLWFPKIILSGTNFFQDMILKLRDRGDISRKTTVSAAGLSYSHELEQRRREKQHGDDDVLTPPPVPFDGANGPQDNGGGRPTGTSSANGAAGSQPRRPGVGRGSRVIARNAGETVRAMWDAAAGTYRGGELTAGILEEYAGTAKVGRMTNREREALDRIGQGELERFDHGALVVIPVNHPYEIGSIASVRLADGLSALVGRRVSDDAVVTRALVFRAPEFDEISAEELAIRLGFGEMEGPEPETPVPGDETAAALGRIHLELPAARAMDVVRDEHGAIIGVQPIHGRAIDVVRDEHGAIAGVRPVQEEN